MAEQDKPTHPLVSVVIPTHNRPMELRAAVESVLNQGFPVEVIVVDDGSTPPVARVGPLGNQSVRVLRHDTPTGPTKARNDGMSKATGEYVAFLDDDDVWLPGKLARSLNVAARHREAKVIAHRTGFDVRQANGRTGSVRVEQSPLRLYATKATPHLNSLLVDADLARSVMFDEDFYACQDVDFVLRLARRTPFALIDAVFALRGQDTAPTAISMERRLAGRDMLMAKHPDVFGLDSRSRSFHKVRIAHLHRRSGHRAKAIVVFLDALRHSPSNGAAWRGIATTILPESFGRVLSVRRRMAAEGRSGIR